MLNWQKIVAGAAVALVVTPSAILARRHFHEASPPPSDPAAAFAGNPAGPDPSGNVSEISAEKSGIIPTKNGRCLRLNLELGNVHVVTDESSQVSYRALVKVDSRDPGAREFLRRFTLTARQTPWGVVLEGKAPWRGLRGRFSASVEIHMPRQYSLQVSTGSGNIDVQDIDGRVSLSSAGGNITVGRVGGADLPARSPHYPPGHIAARVETQGGNVSVGDVAGSLRATTSGGRITAGNIRGDAILRTGGGQIFAGRIEGVATLDTGGGNIHVQSAGAGVTADTAGGQIDFAEAGGAIRTHTGGGAVRIARVTGPAAVDATGGGIVLRRVDAPLQVSANSGGITAWLADESGGKTGENEGIRKLRGASQLSSSEGDIVVFLPRELAATIDALVEQGGGHRIVADPSLPVKISYSDSGAGRGSIHGEGELNGGGETLHLTAVSGNILLRLGDPRWVWAPFARPDAERSARQNVESNAAFPAGAVQGGPGYATLEPLNSEDGGEFSEPDGFFAEIRRRILESWWGGIPVDAAELQKHLKSSVAPVYPEVARQAGIEGDVVLRICVSSRGRVTALKVLDGPPILARAAAQAVQRWQYQSLKVDGQPANVVTTLVVAFRLH
jgi:TonB family protein